jgi:hypothetical protein
MLDEPGLEPTRAVLFGTLTVAALDILDAFVFFWFYRGVEPAVILQSIASGLLGREAYAGGMATAALGALLHTFIAFVVVLVYFLASRRLPVLREHPVLCGALYGVGVWLAMNFVVLPLSAAAVGPQVWPTVVNGLAIHVLGVGIPSALFARAARR